jgi:outer membrane protein assembly factor BamB
MGQQRIMIAAGVLVVSLLLVPASNALFTRLTPLSEVIQEHHFIVVAKVEMLDGDKLNAVFTIEEDLKGKFSVRKLAINLTGDAEAKKLDHTPMLLKRLAPNLPVVLFVNQKSDSYIIFAFTNGTWFQMVAQKAAKPEDTVFAFTHCEPYLTRTFKGTTEEMKKVVVDALSGKRKPPPANDKEPPGLGPEVKPEAKETFTPTRSVSEESSSASSLTLRVGLKDKKPAQFQADKKWIRIINENGNGMALASPLIAGDRAYVAVGHGALARYGVVYCMDLKTHKMLWTFDAGQKMKYCYSSPCLADGRIYIGEGLHEDQNCKLYCIDAKSGKPVWEFPTGSHTESTPVVADGKVYFGAGDDGVYCLDAASGKKVWQFTGPAKVHLHVDSTPAVVGKCVYISSGVDEDTGLGDAAVCCVEAETGKQVWFQRTPEWLVKLSDKKAGPGYVPAWGSPVVTDGVVYVGIGTGRVNASSSAFEPVGGIMALDTTNGNAVWPAFKVADGVLKRPVVDSVAVYFGSRDGNCYSVYRKTGQLRWKAPLGSAAVATPALALTKANGPAANVFAIGSEGRILCLDAETGKVDWSFTDLEKSAPLLVSSPTVIVRAVKEGVERRLYFGACFNGLATPALCCLQDFQPLVNK